MFFVTKYFIKRAFREGIKSLAVPLLSFTLIVLINTLGGIKQWLDYEYNNTMDNHPVLVQLSDLTGEITDGLRIEMEQIELFTDPESTLSLYEYTSSLVLKRSKEVQASGNQENINLVGITSISADENLAPDTGAVIEFFGGYDDSIFKADDFVCVISKDLISLSKNGKITISSTIKMQDVYETFIDPELNPGVTVGEPVLNEYRGTMKYPVTIEYERHYGINIFSSTVELGQIEMNEEDSHFPEYGEDSFTYTMYVTHIGGTDFATVEVTAVRVPGEIITNELSLTIVGTMSGGGINTIYSPFGVVTALIEEFDGVAVYSELLSMTIADNRRLSEFKETASLNFSRVRPIHSTMPIAMTIYDSTFYETIEPLLQNTILVDIAIPIVYVIAVCVGFLAATLLTRQRKSEFAVMRSVGIHRRDVFTGVFSEQLILSLSGAVLGCALTVLIFREISIERPAVLLGCYLIGTIFAAARVAGTNVLKVMKDKE